MKQLVSMCIGLGFAQFAMAQTTVKLYANVMPRSEMYIINKYNTQVNIGTNSIVKIMNPFSIAVQKKINKNKFVEIELGQINASSTIINNQKIIIADTILNIAYTLQAKSIACRVEYGQTILGDASNKWCLQLANALQPSYSKSTVNYTSNNLYNTYNKQFRIAYYSIPHIQYIGKKHLGLDINFPIHIVQIGTLAHSTTNPKLPEAQRNWTIFDVDALNSSKLLGMRIGLVYKL